MVVRQYAVWGGLLATLAACYWVSMMEQETPLVATEKPTEKKSLPYLPSDKRLSAHRNDEQLILRSADIAPPVDLFAPLSVAVGGEAEIAAAQVPTLPNNPYSYAGKISEGSICTVFLTDGANNFAVNAGDDLQAGWRVKRIENDAVVLVYQPLKHEVKLEIGAAL